MAELLVPGLVSVTVRVEMPLTAIVAGENALAAVGGLRLTVSTAMLLTGPGFGLTVVLMTPEV